MILWLLGSLSRSWFIVALELAISLVSVSSNVKPIPRVITP